MHKRTLRLARTTVRVVLLAAVSAVALMTASAASAVNIAPNPGFETDCAGTPCQWSSASGTGIRDMTQHRSGAASLKLTPSASGGASQATEQSACVNASFAAGNVALGYWYRAAAGITGVAMTVNAYSTAGCVGGIAQTSFQPGAIDTSGAWNVVTGNLSLPSAANSFKITLANGCTSGCNGSLSSNFDDVAVGESPPTAVTLASLSASRTTLGVRVAWNVASARDVLGYNVYRGSHKVNRGLVASRGGIGSATYAVLDRSAGLGRITYRLQAVKLDGTWAWLGSARVSS
jgi:hypothetical protein